MTLTITGLVAQPVRIPDNLRNLLRIQRIEDFVCVEGWNRPNQAWAGYSLTDLLQLAEPTANGRYIEIGAVDFVTTMALDALGGTLVLLADTLNGQRLTKDTGGPWRLVVSGGAYYQSVKGVDHLFVTSHNRHDTARIIALSRIGRNVNPNGS